MTPLIGCEIARDLLEPLVDGELSTGEQVAVEAHVRSCRVCAARVSDLSLIGWSVRTGTPAIQPQADDARALAAVQSGVLTRIRTERSQALRARLGEMFADMRLLWPAMGATVAVIGCLCGVVNVWHLTTLKSPNSLAAMLEAMENPGSDDNPLPLGAGNSSIPRALDEGGTLDALFQQDALATIVVGTTGRVTHAELQTLIGSLDTGTREQAVVDALKERRFAPAQIRSGRAVAVEAVMFFTQVTVASPLAEGAVPRVRPHPAVPGPAPAPPSAVPGTQSSIARTAIIV